MNNLSSISKISKVHISYRASYSAAYGDREVYKPITINEPCLSDDCRLNVAGRIKSDIPYDKPLDYDNDFTEDQKHKLSKYPYTEELIKVFCGMIPGDTPGGKPIVATKDGQAKDGQAKESQDYSMGNNRKREDDEEGEDEKEEGEDALVGKRVEFNGNVPIISPHIAPIGLHCAFESLGKVDNVLRNLVVGGETTLRSKLIEKSEGWLGTTTEEGWIGTTKEEKEQMVKDVVNHVQDEGYTFLAVEYDGDVWKYNSIEYEKDPTKGIREDTGSLRTSIFRQLTKLGGNSTDSKKTLETLKKRLTKQVQDNSEERRLKSAQRLLKIERENSLGTANPRAVFPSIRPYMNMTMDQDDTEFMNKLAEKEIEHAIREQKNMRETLNNDVSNITCYPSMLACITHTN